MRRIVGHRLPKTKKNKQQTRSNFQFLTSKEIYIGLYVLNKLSDINKNTVLTNWAALPFLASSWITWVESES